MEIGRVARAGWMCKVGELEAGNGVTELFSLAIGLRVRGSGIKHDLKVDG